MKDKLIKEIKPKRIVFYSVALTLGIAIDLISKIIIATFLKPIGEITIIPGIVKLSYVENKGAAWGMLADHRWVFLSLSTVAIIGILFYLYTGWAQSKLLSASLTLICAGGIGNMVDRLSLGYVIDFIKADFIDFPVFNIADSFVTIGAGMMILYLVLEIIKEAKAKKDGESK